MSIKIDPTPSNNNSGNLPERKLSLREKYVRLVVEGHRLERTPCPQYCEEKWNEQRITSNVQQIPFMNQCLKECDFFKSFAE